MCGHFNVRYAQTSQVFWKLRNREYSPCITIDQTLNSYQNDKIYISKGIKGDIMYLRIKIVLLGVLLIFLVTTANAGEVSKEVWMDGMSTGLPTMTCQSKQFYMQCFEVTQIECEETALSATRICLEKYKEKIPIVLNQEDGGNWGTIIGRCAGEAYGMAVHKKKIDSEKCNNPANWQ